MNTHHNYQLRRRRPGGGLGDHCRLYSGRRRQTTAAGLNTAPADTDPSCDIDRRPNRSGSDGFKVALMFGG